MAEEMRRLLAAVHGGVRETRVGVRLRRLRAAWRLRPAHTSDFESRLVWIVGSPRTGSSWLLRMLASHGRVVAIDEPQIGWYLGPFVSDLPGGSADDLDLSNFTLRVLQRDRAAQFFAETFAAVWAPQLGRLIRERFYAHARLFPAQDTSAPSLVVIKEPNGSQSIDVLMRAVPRARLLFLLRDGRDVVDSELAANLPDSWVTREFPGLRGIPEAERLNFVVQSAHKWLWRTEIVQRTCDRYPSQSHLVRYEDLVADPAGQLGGILDWLGLACTSQELESCVERYAFQRISAGVTGPTEFFRSGQPGAWRTNLRADEQAALERILGPTLRGLGYERSGPVEARATEPVAEYQAATPS